MDENARLLLAEHLVPPGNQPFPGALIDISMLVNTGGQERTEAEFRALLTSGGFNATQIVRTGWRRLIKGVPA